MEKSRNETPQVSPVSRDAMSLINNLRYATKGYRGADKVKFILKALKRVTGDAEQYWMVQMISYAFENDPTFDAMREKIDEAWQVELEQRGIDIR